MSGSALLEREGAAVAALDVAAARGAGAARGGRACCAPCRVLHVWSGPRCLSTSCLYAFAQHGRVARVLDEPLYAHWLHRHPEVERPYKEALFASQSSDGQDVLDRLVCAETGSSPETAPMEGKEALGAMGVTYVKHIGKFYCGNLRLAPQLTAPGHYHVVMARDPERVLGSFAEVVTPDMAETGYPELLQIVHELDEARAPLLCVDANELAADAERTLRRMCAFSGIGWDEGMLSWDAGGRPEDGVWAPYWYGSVHASTGFERAAGERPPRAQLPDALRPLAEECTPLYRAIVERAAADKVKYASSS